MKSPSTNQRFTLSLMAALISQATLAEQTIEETVVWGTKVYASSVSLDSEAMAIKQSDHISDLLRPIPGVDVGGAHSLNQRITIRSIDDKDLRITIDGANQNTYMYHHMGNLQIHADILKSVEVQVGNNSVVNGGLGGAVRFETREARDLLRPGERFGARAQVTLADNASNNYAVSGYGQLTDTVDILGYYNFVDRENYEVGGGEILDAAGREIPGTDGEVRGLEGELTDALVKVGWNLSDNQRLKFGYESYADEGNYSYRPDMGLATDLAIADTLGIPLVYPTEFTRDTLTLNYDLVWGDSSALTATLFRNESTLWRDETGLVSWRPPLATINEGEAENTGFNVLANSAINAGVLHNLTYGVDVIQYETAFSMDGVFQSGEEATNSAAFIEDRIEIGDFSVTPGMRYDSYDLDTAVVNKTYSDTTFALAADYEVMNAILLSTSTTQLFKGPEIGQVFTGAGLYDVPNPDIEAETGNNTELAAVYQGRIFTSGVTLFRTEIENYIFDFANNPAGGFWKDNVGDMEIEGYEAYAEYHQNGWRALVTYASAESELDAFEQYAQYDGARIDRQQGDSLSFALDYDFADLNLTLHWDVQYADDVGPGLDLDFASDDTNNAKDSYTVHNISARWTPEEILEGLAVTVGVDNLFDEFYASQSSRTGTSFHPLFGQLYLLDYEPGRNIKATVAYQF
jgi:hemoglobin/transferrin/lactoferrin receptor protein